MRPLLVVLATEAPKSLLLRAAMGRRRARRVGFQHGMELLMRSILFRSPERDPFRHDPEAHPPDIQARTSRRRAEERLAVIAANPVGQPIVAKRALEAPAGEERPAAEQRITPQHIAAEPVSQRQRIAVPPGRPCGTAPLKWVVHVAFGRVMGGSTCGPCSRASRRRRGTTTPCRRSRSQTVNRLGQAVVGSSRVTITSSLLAPQRGWRCRTRSSASTTWTEVVAGVIMRSSRSIVQPARAGGLVPRHPFVARFAAGPVLGRQLSHREQATEILTNELQSSIHGYHLPPRHRVPPAKQWRKVLPMYLDCFVTYVSGLNRPEP